MLVSTYKRTTEEICIRHDQYNVTVLILISINVQLTNLNGFLLSIF